MPGLTFPRSENFYAFEPMMEEGLMRSAILQRHPSTHNLAMPNWTIIPMLYHAPPDYDMERTEEPVIRDGESVGNRKYIMHNMENRKYILHDNYETVWEIDAKDLDAHGAAMRSVQKHASAGLSAMKCLKYYEAVEDFDRALSEMWSCHRDAPMELWIKTHRGHALLRAGLLQSPALHGKKTHHLLQMSCETLSECVDTLRPLLNCGAASRGRLSFVSSLFFSGLLGLAWISFFQENMEETEKYVAEAQAVSVDPSHLRAGAKPGIDTKFLQIALRRAIGTPRDVESFGTLVSNYYEDSFLADILDMELQQLKGNSALFITFLANTSLNPEKSIKLTHIVTMKPPQAVVEFMDRLEAGYAGNMWLAVGAVEQARVAYEYAYASESVLLRAAALVGLGNVLLRLSDVKRKVSASVGNGSTDSEMKYKEALDGISQKYNEALEIYDELGFREGQVIVHCNLGNLHHKQEQREEALEQYNTALSYLSERSTKSSAALHLHLKFVELHLESDNLDEANKSLEAVSILPRSQDDLLTNAWIHSVRGNFFLKKGMSLTDGRFTKVLAKNNLKDAVELYAKIQRGIGTADAQSLWLTIFEQQKETYARLLWCLACQSDSTSNGPTNSAVEALVWCERSRSRVAMSENWGRGFFSLVSDDEVAVREAMNAMSSQSFDALPWKECWNHLQVLLSRCKLPAVTVVEYAVCMDFGLLIFVLEIPGGKPKMLPVSFKEQKLDMESLSALVNQTVFLLDPRKSATGDQLEKNLAILSELLIKPVEKWLKDSQQIIVIPHEVLFKVPFHALMKSDRKEYLIQRHTLSCVESIRSLVQCSFYWEQSIHLQEMQDDHINSVSSDKKARKTWLVVGIDKHQPFDRDLNEAEREAEAVADLLAKRFNSNGTGKKFLGSLATKDQLMPHFGEADIIHLATHGKINAKYERGGIRLAVPAGLGDVKLETFNSTADPDDATIRIRSTEDLHENVKQWHRSKDLEEKIVLSAIEISRMKLKAQLVVLSACQSADGVILGDGVAGLGRALLEAEVPCTVLSLWPVSDDATIFFMKEFYEGLARGGSVADAMGAAMITMINAEGVNPYNTGKKRKLYKVGHWAPFWAFGLPIVQVANPAPGLKNLITKRVSQLVMGSVGVVVGSVLGLAFAKRSKSKDLTRSSASDASVQHAWNPLHFNSAVPTKPTSNGRRLGLVRGKLVILGLTIFHLMHRGVHLDHDKATLSD